jgi:dihydrodipicolinate reductase
MAQLVLTVVELLRQLIERQALRRVEHGTLTEMEEEQLGLALMRLADTMADLKIHFGFNDEDLNIHLGPLGDLL